MGTMVPLQCSSLMKIAAVFFMCLLPLATLAGCALPAGQVPMLVSAQFPPGTGDVNVKSEPQPLNSLPVGAANFAPTPFATQPSFFSFKIGSR